MEIDFVSKYIQEKRKARARWEKQISLSNKVPSFYEQMLFDWFNRVWNAGLYQGKVYFLYRDRIDSLPYKSEYEVYEDDRIQYFEYKDLCAVDAEVYSTAYNARNLPGSPLCS